jgi:hypothetical protein
VILRKIHVDFVNTAICHLLTERRVEIILHVHHEGRKDNKNDDNVQLLFGGEYEICSGMSDMRASSSFRTPAG